jgi:glycosyltransferase involved in cell wall biosynthesis
MKFALVGPAYPYRGGISQYTTSLYHALNARHDVLLVSFSRQYPRFFFPGSSQQDDSSDAFMAPNERMLDSINPPSWKRAGRRICEYEPDLLLFQWWQPFFGMAFAKVAKVVRRESGARVAYLCHNVYPHERLSFQAGKWLENYLIRRAFSESDGFLVHAEEMVAQVREINPSAVVRRIYHPLYDFYSRWEADKDSLGQRAGKKRLLFFGKVRPYKGLDVLLRALGRLKGSLDFEAVIAGEFYMDSVPFKKLADELGLTERLIWHERYIPNEAVPEFFQEADLVVLPYQEATQSGVVPVAYQFETPVVVGDAGGLSEVVLHGKTGYLFPPGDDAVLADRIQDFFRLDKGEEFRDNISLLKERLSWDHVVEEIVGLFSGSGRGERNRGAGSLPASPSSSLGYDQDDKKE